MFALTRIFSDRSRIRNQSSELISLRRRFTLFGMRSKKRTAHGRPFYPSQTVRLAGGFENCAVYPERLPEIGARSKLFISSASLRDPMFPPGQMHSSGLGSHCVFDEPHNCSQNDTADTAASELADNTIENRVQTTAGEHRKKLAENDPANTASHGVTRCPKADVLGSASNIATDSAGNQLENDRQ